MSLNCFVVLSRKTLSCYLKIKSRNLHIGVLKHNSLISSAKNYHKIEYLFKEKYAEIHFSVGMFAKSFRETENEYSHDLLQTIPAYAKSTVKQPSSVNMEDFSGCNKELIEFAKVTKYCMSLNINLEDGLFSSPVSNLVECLPSLSNENLLRCLYLLCCLPPTPKTWTPNFKVLWNSLDAECVRRLLTWNNSEKLLVADYWFHLRLNRISQYNRNMIVDLLHRLDKLTDAEMVQLMFYVNLQREVPSNSLKALEKRLLPVMKTISIKELGIVCLAFFKNKYKLSDISVIKTVIERFINEIEIAEQVTLVSLLKFLKKSMHLPYTELYIPLLHKCTAYTLKWDVLTCIHLALLASECHVYHPLLLDSVIERICSTIECARLKDLMKLLQCLSHFNHPPPPKFNDLLFSELWKESKKTEILSQPRVLIYIALYYSYIGYYNHELLNIVLDANFATKCISIFPETNMTFAEVDSSTEIECKDYTGNRLGKSSWKILEKRRGKIDLDSKRPNALARLTNEILCALPSKKNVYVRHILPHTFSPDIIIQLFGDKKSLPSDKDAFFFPPKEETWACLVIGVPFSFTYRSKHKTGVTSMKIRQLEKLGYKTVFIPFYEFPRDIERRKNYLEDKLRYMTNCSNLMIK